MALFRKFERNKGRTKGDPVLESIIDNLNNILNTKRDYGSFLHDYGIRDLNEYSSRTAIAEAVIGEVRESIERFEPRVELNEVTLINEDNPLHLAFKIDCVVHKGAKSLRLVFDTVFNTCNIAESESTD